MTAINVNQLLRDIFTPALPQGLSFVTKRPGDLGTRLPLVYARHVGGSDVDPRRAAWASIVVDSYSALNNDPFEHAKWAHDRLVDVVEQQTVFEHGWVNRLEVLMPPWDNDDSLASSVTNRSTAEYRLLVRPPVTA